jgi:hypothetical protein
MTPKQRIELVELAGKVEEVIETSGRGNAYGMLLDVVRRLKDMVQDDDNEVEVLDPGVQRLQLALTTNIGGEVKGVCKNWPVLQLIRSPVPVVEVLRGAVAMQFEQLMGEDK